VQTSANTTTPAARTWNGDTTHLGWVTIGNQTWTVHAHLNRRRYEKYDYELASLPAIIGTPEEQIISYPVPDRESVTTRVLMHAPHYLTRHYPHLAGAVGWQPLTVPSGRTVRHAEVATIEFLDERIPVFARFDEDMSAAYGDGFPGVVVTNQNQGGRELVVYVPSMDTTRGEVFRILAELGRID
jgi:hypothetical protein